MLRPLPGKRLDLRVARMSTQNGGPVSSRRRKIMSRISIFVLNTLTLKYCEFFKSIAENTETALKIQAIGRTDDIPSVTRYNLPDRLPISKYKPWSYKLGSYMTNILLRLKF